MSIGEYLLALDIVMLANLKDQSIFADMGMTIGDYIPKLLKVPSEKLRCSVGDMHVSKPLIVEPSPKNQLLHIKLTGDFSQGHLVLEFESPDSPAKATATHHAKCVLRFSDPASWLNEWSRSAYLIRSRIDILQHSENNKGSVNKVSEGLAYKLFASLVDYAPPYRGMKEVTFNSQDYEATALVKLEDHPSTGNFFLKPFWIDSLVHLSGFVMNASDATDSKKNVYISHGWDEMRFATEVSSNNKPYTVYVKMQFIEPKVVAGDVYIFEDEKIVGLCSGLRFQQIPKALLNILLPPTSGKAERVRQAKVPSDSRPVVEPKVVIPKQVSARGNNIVSSGDMIQRVISLLADEIGMSVNELSGEKTFSSLGVDSLLTLSIVGRLQTIFNIEAPSTIFMDHPTIGDFERFLQGFFSQPKTEHVDEDLENPDQGYSSLDTTQQNSPLASLVPSGTSTPISLFEGDSQILRLAIARETGIPVEKIVGSTCLNAIGLDSIMALSIMAQLESSQATDLGHTAFFKSRTVGELENNLGFASSVAVPQIPFHKKIIEDHDDQIQQPSLYTATSIFLQRKPGTLGKSLFLLPDGSGSAASYAKLPSLTSPSSSIAAVIGLNSPFLRKPEACTCGIPGLARLYLEEITRIQLRGPYSLGGWSIGGIIAFEAACQLLASGQEVENLVLIDSPCPTVVEPMPHALIRYFDSVGLFSSIPNKDTKTRLFEHFAASVASLRSYKPSVLPALKKELSVTIIWAKMGIRAPPGTTEVKLEEKDRKPAEFMMSDRTEVQVGEGWGWKELLVNNKKGAGSVKMRSVLVRGNHFSMMDEPWVSWLGSQMPFWRHLSSGCVLIICIIGPACW